MWIVENIEGGRVKEWGKRRMRVELYKREVEEWGVRN